jgi:carbon storage regulator
MLVLSRKKNESIVINGDIVIVVVEIRGDKVRLGVEVPKEIPVHRGEVYDAIRRESHPRPWYAPDEPSCREESEFLEAIAANPGDGALLLVYADWLEERGNPRSEVIRRGAP